MLVFLLLGSGIIGTGAFSYLSYKQHNRTEVEHQLSAIADLKVGELSQWREERLADAAILFNNPSFSLLVRRFLEKPGDPETQSRLLDWLEKYPAYNNYDQVRLLDAQGVSRLELPPGRAPVSSTIVREVSEVLRSGQIVFQDFYRNEHDGRIYLAVLVPIFDERDAARPLGVLVLRVNPQTYLYPFVQRWPTPSRTAETLLVRRDGDEVVFLNELRFRTDAALKVRSPLKNLALPAAQAALGREGGMEGVDYRGVPVMAALRVVPHSPWSLVARVDLAEMNEPMKGRLRQTILMIVVLLFAAGAFMGLFWRQQTVRFYREKLQAEESLRASEQSYRALFENMLGGFAYCRMVYDEQQCPTDFVYLEVNKAFEQLTGLENVVGKPVSEVVPGIRESDPRLFETCGRVAQTGIPETFEIYLGSMRMWFAISAYCPAQDHFVAVFDVINERKRAEAEIVKLNAELEQRVSERTLQLESANKELEAFSYSVSHDLRAPLRHVQGYVDMLAREAEGRLSDTGRHYMRTIADASREMGVLIDDLLAFSRMGRAEMRETSVNLDALVRETLRDLETVTRERNIVWKMPPLPAVQADPAMLKLVLANLLGNAVKFTRPREPALIEIGSGGMEGERVVIFVRDNGVGFDPQYAHKLFGVFQRLHRADEFEGTGIGLANVRRIISRHGGRTWAEGALGHGATFYVTLKSSSTANAVN